MITLEIRISGHGPAHLALSSGTIAGVRLNPPQDGSVLGASISNLGLTSVSIASVTGAEGTVWVDINEGPDPVWLSYTIDSTGGGTASVAFPGSPTLRVNAGSYLGMEYNNGNPPPAPAFTEHSYHE